MGLDQAQKEAKEKQSTLFPPSQKGGGLLAAQQEAMANTQTTVAPPTALPDGAKGFDVYGRPYFGDGLVGIVKKWNYNMTRDIKPTTDDQWADFRARWDANAKKLAEHDTFTNPFAEGAQEKQAQLKTEQDAQNAMIGEGIIKKATDIVDSSEGSPIAPLVKAVPATITAVLDAFNVPSKRLEQAIGAVQGLQSAARKINWVPNVEDSPFVQGLLNNPIGWAYSAMKIAFAPQAQRTEALKEIEESWHAGRVLASQVLDQSLKDDFIRRYRNGEDPGLLQIEMENVGAELVFGLVADPLNFIGAPVRALKSGKELAAAEKLQTASGLLETAKGEAALNAYKAAKLETDAIKALDDMDAAHLDVIAKVNGNRLLQNSYSASDLTTQSRHFSLVSRASDNIGFMARTMKANKMSMDEIAEAIVYGIKSVSDGKAARLEGYSGLANLPSSHLWFSEPFVESFSFMKRMVSGADGAMDFSKIKALTKTKSMSQFAEKALDLMTAGAKTAFPEVNELEQAAELAGKADEAKKLAAKAVELEAAGDVAGANKLRQKVKSIGGTEVTKRVREMADAYNELPSSVKYISRANRVASKPKDAVNAVMGSAFFDLSGGYTVRNALSDSMLMMIDQGPKAWFSGGYQSFAKDAEYLTDIYGKIPEGVGHGFTNELNKPKLFGKINAPLEQGRRTKVFATAARDAIKKMIKKLPLNVEDDIARGVLTQREVDRFKDMLYLNGGNVEKTAKEFRDMQKLGFVEDWRNLDYISPYEKAGLERMGYWDELAEMAYSGKALTKDDVTKVLDKWRASIETRAGMSVTDPVGLHDGHPSSDLYAEILNAAKEGFLTNEQSKKFAALEELAEQARNHYLDALEQSAKVAQDALMRTNPAKASDIGQQMVDINSSLRRVGPQATKERRALMTETMKWYEAMRQTDDPKELAQLWFSSGIPQAPPLGLTQFDAKSALWQWAYGEATKITNMSFDDMLKNTTKIREQLNGVVDTAQLDSAFRLADQATTQVQAIREVGYANHAFRIKGEGVEWLAKEYNIKGPPQKIVNTINKYLPEGVAKFTDLKSIPADVAKQALEARRVARGLPEPVFDGIAIPPPHPDGAMPTMPRIWSENSKGALNLIDQIEAEIAARWGKVDDARAFNPEKEKAFQKMLDTAKNEMPDIHKTAAAVATENTNFTLQNYAGGKTYADAALGYVMPYHFYYTQSIPKWLKRLATNPEVIAAYAKNREALEKINHDAPEWYKHQLNVTELLGIDTENPLYLNLEAAINPLYSLTGTDYNDPQKRVNWATATMDDITKFGPTFWTPIQMAIAGMLKASGEDEAAARWGGRLFPQTRIIKDLTALAGKPIEFDPNVLMFSDGIEPSERNRMARAAGELVESGQFSAEKVQDDFLAQQGEAWDEAYRLAATGRAGADTLSFILGVGFKPRTKNDVMIEQMYTDINQLYAMSETMNSAEFSSEWERVRQKYPDGFMDTVLLAKSGGERRDAAYAYSVLARIPPGQIDDVLKSVGISYAEIEKFLDSKGFTKTDIAFADAEKQRFMAAMTQLGAMIKIPDDATRTEWTLARSQYQTANADIENVLGADIWDKVDVYYEIKEQDKDLAEAMFPEARQALLMRREAIVNSPILSAYYGGIDNIEAYVSGKIRWELQQQFGQDIYQKQAEYYMVDSPNSYINQHPELRAFFSAKKDLEKKYQPIMLQMAAALQDPKGSELRPEFNPSSDVQERFLASLNQNRGVKPWAEVSQGMPDWLQKEVREYWASGRRISKRGYNELKYLADQNGYYDADDLLMSTGYALQSQP